MERSIHYSGKELFYLVSGKGPGVMLVHGFGEDGSIWNYQRSELEKRFTIIIPDLPGSGKSEMYNTGTSNDFTTIDQHAEALNEILINEKIEACVMIGHSMGGYIGLAFAEKWPEKLTGLGLFHSSAFADNDEKKATRLKAIQFINENVSAAFLKTAIPNLFGQAFKTSNPETILETIDRYSYFSKGALTGYYYAMIARPDRIHVLENFKKPVLFIIGEQDTAVPLEISLKQCHIPTQSHVHILPGNGHMSMLESAHETTGFLSGFFDHCFAGNDD